MVEQFCCRWSDKSGFHFHVNEYFLCEMHSEAETMAMKSEFAECRKAHVSFKGSILFLRLIEL